MRGIRCSSCGLTGVGPAASCVLTRVAAQPDITLADLAEEIGTSTANLAPSLDQLVSHSLVATDPSGGAITLTEHGRSAIERLRAAREDDLRELLDGWPPEEEPELDQRLRSLARDCMNADAASCAVTNASGQRPDVPGTTCTVSGRHKDHQV